MTPCDLHAAALMASVRPHVKRAAARPSDLLAGAVVLGLYKQAVPLEAAAGGAELLSEAGPAIARGFSKVGPWLGRLATGAKNMLRSGTAVEGAEAAGINAARTMGTGAARTAGAVTEDATTAARNAMSGVDQRIAASQPPPLPKGEPAAPGQIPSGNPKVAPSPPEGWKSVPPEPTGVPGGGTTQAASTGSKWWPTNWKVMPWNWGKGSTGSFGDKMLGTSAFGKMMNVGGMFSGATMAAREMDMNRELENTGAMAAANALHKVRNLSPMERLAFALGPESIVQDSVAKQYPAVASYWKQMESQAANKSALPEWLQHAKSIIYGPPAYTPNHPPTP